MQTFHKSLLTLLLIFCSTLIFAQDRSAEIKALTEAGIKLHDDGKFDDAIAKYTEALKIDPAAEKPLYEAAYSYYESSRPDEALKFLERVIKINPKSAEAYDILGSIYDDKGIYDKALSYYNEGVKADSTYQRLHFNLSIFHLRQKAYAEAEKCAITAIKLDPDHASSYRVYALATLNLNKRAPSLFGWCSFLLLEPQSSRSPDAVNHVKFLINFGIQRDEKGNTKTTISPNSEDMTFSLAVVSATSDKKNLSPVDSLSLQLKSLFEVLNASTETTYRSFYSKFFVEYFKNMAKSGNVPAFAHYITLSTDKIEDSEWFVAHDDDIKKFDKWYSTTARTYE